VQPHAVVKAHRPHRRGAGGDVDRLDLHRQTGPQQALAVPAVAGAEVEDAGERGFRAQQRGEQRVDARTVGGDHSWRRLTLPPGGG
jgi:hypothetical protein